MTKESKYSSIHYGSYLQLEKVLDAQNPRSGIFGEPAHEEMLFIIIHQVYELWFKQINHEVSSIMNLFDKDMIDEKTIGQTVGRLNRVIEILKLLIQQINVLETMTPLDFLDFRNLLFPASGFQSYQFRLLEVSLGLQTKSRLTYNHIHYAKVFSEERQNKLREIEEGDSLLELVEKWLERTPFLDFKGFNFLELYKGAVEKMIAKEQEAIRNSEILSEKYKNMRLKMMGDTDSYFASILDKNVHQKLREEGKAGISYKATLAALLINLYRDEPILQMPYRLLAKLGDIDEYLTTWRYRHSQMVLRMIGKKIGTGGSSGHDYLRATAEKHHVFLDFQNISTLLIPRSELPELPDFLKKQLGFFFSSK